VAAWSSSRSGGRGIRTALLIAHQPTASKLGELCGILRDADRLVGDLDVGWQVNVCLDHVFGVRRASVTDDARGAALPVVATRHQLLITAPIPGVGAHFPIARVIDANVYVRHERGGLMLGGYEADPLQLDAPPDDVTDLPLDIDVLWRLAASVREQFPIFQDPAIHVVEHRGGLPTRWTIAIWWVRCRVCRVPG
jgi:hypothetical protein